MKKRKQVTKPQKDYQTVAQLSEKFHVARKTILNWIYSDRLKAYRTAGGTYRIYNEEVDKIATTLGLYKRAKTIMIMDDSTSIIKTLTQYIRNLYPNITVHSSTSGIRGLIMLGNTNADLLILDIKIPDLDGFKVIDELKRTSQQVKVCILSGFLDEPTIERLKKLGITEYLHKPVDVWKFKEKIDHILNL